MGRFMAVPASSGGRLRAAFSPRATAHALWSPPARHLRPLDGLRALSIVWVVVFHSAWYGRLVLPEPATVRLLQARGMLPVWRGDFGVDLFFVLSGFLIAGMLLDERAATGTIALGRFYARRLARLWPAMLVVLGLVAGRHPEQRGTAWATALY
ncbi:MAG: acyltransferase, partial [Myxococcales bacterium]